MAAVLNSHILPFADSVKVVPGVRRCRDPDDDKFIWCAQSGQADALITGDQDLLALRGKIAPIVIWTPAEDQRIYLST